MGKESKLSPMLSPSPRPTFRPFWSFAIVLIVVVVLAQISLRQAEAFQTYVKGVTTRINTKPLLVTVPMGNSLALMEPRILVSPLQFYVEHNPAPNKNTELLTIENQGNTLLVWELAETQDESCMIASNLEWVSVSETAGATPPGSATLLNVKFNSFGLEEGDYEGWICISSNDPIQPVIAVRLQLKVEFPVTTTPTPTASRTPTRTATVGIATATRTPTSTVITGIPTATRTPTRTATLGIPTPTNTPTPPFGGSTATPTATPPTSFDYGLYLPMARRR